MSDQSDEAAARALAEGAAALSGAAVSAGIGMLVGGPPGALGGAVVGSLIEVGADFARRHLSDRQNLRVGTALGYAADRAWFRLMANDQIRDDGFFELEGARRPSDEVGEAVLLAVRDEPETRKAQYMGYLLGNIGFEPSVDQRTAQSLVAEAESLTFTQFCLLALVKLKDAFPLPPKEPGTDVLGSLEAVTVRHQFEDLGYARRELIGVAPPSVGLPTNIGVAADQELRSRGHVLVELLEVERIPEGELREVWRLLWRCFGHEPPG